MAGRLAPAEVARLRTNLSDQELLIKDPVVAVAVSLDAAFHALFAEFLGNAEILRVMAQIRERMHRVITKVFHVNPGRIATSYDEHKAIAEAVIAGDGALAARLMEQHLEYGKQFLLSPRGR